MSIVQDQKYICKQNANRAFFNVKKARLSSLELFQNNCFSHKHQFPLSQNSLIYKCFRNFDSNKAKGQISKRMFQENKVRQIFQKNEHFLPPDMHMYVLLKIHRSFKTTTFPFTEVQPLLPQELVYWYFDFVSSQQLKYTIKSYAFTSLSRCKSFP